MLSNRTISSRPASEIFMTPPRRDRRAPPSRRPAAAPPLLPRRSEGRPRRLPALPRATPLPLRRTSSLPAFLRLPCCRAERTDRVDPDHPVVGLVVVALECLDRGRHLRDELPLRLDAGIQVRLPGLRVSDLPE